MRLDKDERLALKIEGGQDAAAGRTSCLNGPWCGPLESFDHYEERVDAYNEGRREYEESSSNSESDKGSSCFFTTACVGHAGLPDDCEELRILRGFRDRYVAKLPDGPIMIGRYYREAPAIVKAIEESPTADFEMRKMLLEIRDVVSEIKKRRFDNAVGLYKIMFQRLSGAYSPCLETLGE